MKSFTQLRDWLIQREAKPKHEGRILRTWLAGRSVFSSPSPKVRFPSALLAALPELDTFLAGLGCIEASHPGADGSVKLLVRLSDGQWVESVLLPRGGLCVSSQVGCAVACQFCRTGRDGLARQLSTLEILVQVVLARQIRAVNKVVFMGMGEPSHNLEAVFEAIDALAVFGAIGHKNLVFSTVGDLRAFDRLRAATIKPALALSIHTMDADFRRRLLPKAAPIGPHDLVAFAREYAALAAYPVQLQWTLLKGQNDRPADIYAVADAVGDGYVMVNLIPYNDVGLPDCERPHDEHSWSLLRLLRQRGIIATLRVSAGQDVDGGCGQLRSRAAVVQMPRSLNGGGAPDTSL